MIMAYMIMAYMEYSGTLARDGGACVRTTLYDRREEGVKINIRG
jgi:hypothetical protein